MFLHSRRLLTASLVAFIGSFSFACSDDRESHPAPDAAGAEPRTSFAFAAPTAGGGGACVIVMCYISDAASQSFCNHDVAQALGTGLPVYGPLIDHIPSVNACTLPPLPNGCTNPTFIISGHGQATTTDDTIIPLGSGGNISGAELLGEINRCYPGTPKTIGVSTCHSGTQGVLGGAGDGTTVVAHCQADQVAPGKSDFVGCVVKLDANGDGTISPEERAAFDKGYCRVGRETPVIR